MKIIYLAAYKANHPNYEITYQDINGLRDISGDMLEVDLKPYDLVIATPPCNYWSRANYRREKSEYAQKTKHLLPDILAKVIFSKKDFIVENVRNQKLFALNGLYDLQCFIYEIGRHTYWSSIYLSSQDLDYLKSIQTKDFSSGAKRVGSMYLLPNGELSLTNRVKRLKKNTQGGDNVHNVIEYMICKYKEYKRNEN